MCQLWPDPETGCVGPDPITKDLGKPRRGVMRWDGIQEALHDALRTMAWAGGVGGLEAVAQGYSSSEGPASNTPPAPLAQGLSSQGTLPGRGSAAITVSPQCKA